MHQHLEWRSTNIYPFKLVPNPNWDYLLLGDFRGLQTANLELCSEKSMLTAHLDPDDWNLSDAFLFSLKISWGTPSGSSVHSNLPMKTSHNSSSLSVVLMGDRNWDELYLQPSRLPILVFIPREYPTCSLTGRGFTNLHHCSFLCKCCKRRIFEYAESVPKWRKKHKSGRARRRPKEWEDIWLA